MRAIVPKKTKFYCVQNYQLHIHPTPVEQPSNAVAFPSPMLVTRDKCEPHSTTLITVVVVAAMIMNG